MKRMQNKQLFEYAKYLIFENDIALMLPPRDQGGNHFITRPPNFFSVKNIKERRKNIVCKCWVALFFMFLQERNDLGLQVCVCRVRTSCQCQSRSRDFGGIYGEVRNVCSVTQATGNDSHSCTETHAHGHA